MDKKYKAILIGVITSILILLIIGIPTALIKNSYYTRMTPITSLDYFFLIIISLLIGLYVSLSYYDHAINKESYLLTFGGILGFFTVACSLCSALLVYLFSTGLLLAYFEPFQPLIGVISILLISSAIYIRLKNLRSKR